MFLFTLLSTAFLFGTTYKQNTSTQQLQPPLDYDWGLNYTGNKNDLPAKLMQLYQSARDGSLNPNITSTVSLFITKKGVLKFPTEKVLRGSLIDAELFVYRSYDEFSNYIIRLYKILPTYHHHSVDNADFHKLLHVAYISSKSGWLVFKVKKAIDDWFKGDPNLGFLLTASDSLERPLNVTFVITKSGQFRPFLILHFNDGDFNETTKNCGGGNKETCAREPRFVNFGDYGWGNFVIAPESFDAGFCSGSCVYERLSNNARLIGGQDPAKKFECAPSSYKSLPVMFFDGNGNVIIRKYRRMIIETCGCP